MAGYSKEYSFDEISDAEEVIKNGFTNNVVNGREAELITRYLKEFNGFGAVRMERELIRFCKAHDPNFNLVLERNRIKYWIKRGLQNTLRKVNSIRITQVELDIISNVEKELHRKVLFCMLVMSKALRKGRTRRTKTEPIFNKYFLFFDKIPIVMKLAGLNMSEDELGITMSKISKEKLFTFYYPEKEIIWINFADDESDVALEIENPSDALKYYQEYLTGVSYYCARCGTKIVKTGRNHKHCAKCQADIKREATRKSMQKIRKNVIFFGHPENN